MKVDGGPRATGWSRARTFVENLRHGERIRAFDVAEAAGVTHTRATRYMRRCVELGLVEPAGRTRLGIQYVRVRRDM